MTKILPKKLTILATVCILVLVSIYYYSRRLVPRPPARLPDQRSQKRVEDVEEKEDSDSPRQERCGEMQRREADIETENVFPGLEMEPAWMERREYWGNEMEDRYVKRKSMWPSLPLRVIIMPHSHNDPGWLQTYEGYFATATRGIITNIVNKLTQHRNMTFIWTEVSFLSMWWNVATSEDKIKMRRLVEEKRLEIATGGWIMTDEANVEMFSMLDQLVEGHAWLRQNLGVVPTSSWSVDPFGHGAAFPHLLAKSGVDNMVIMRIHYAWKEWFARHQLGDFKWKQSWEVDDSSSPLCHNFPYDIYSIKHSCGPHPHTCLGFDFRHVDGEYNEFSVHYTPVDQHNVRMRAELLLEQYGRTGSLFPHNVVLVPLGDDFRYNKDIEFDQQYENYMALMKHINTGEYNAHVTFGTLTDYFTEVKRRMKKFRTLTGDFFVYSDIFSEGRPAYWSGYYTTRPYMKRLSRQLASQLRTAEILYTAMVHSPAAAEMVSTKQTELLYDYLAQARQNLGLFQHHDAITGTSRSFVMQDYGMKLLEGVKRVRDVQSIAVQKLLTVDKMVQHMDMLVEDFSELPTRATLDMTGGASRHTVVIFNPLTMTSQQVASVKTNSANVCVEDSQGENVDVQISPAVNTEAIISRQKAERRLNLGQFDVSFIAELPALGFATYRVTFCDRSSDDHSRRKSKVYCSNCPQTDTAAYTLSSLPPGAVQIENKLYRLLFSPDSKLLRNVTNKLSGVSMPLDIEFSAYNSAPFRSGAYLFQTDPSKEAESELFGESDLKDLIVVSGPVFSQMTAVWEVESEVTHHQGQQPPPAVFLHTVRLYHMPGHLSEAVHVENLFDFGASQRMKDKELFMRLRSGVRNGEPASFYSDQSGLGMQKRVWVDSVGLEGNYYPVTTAAYLEDAGNRITVLVDHAAGAAAVKEGWLEVMVDRRTVFDDGRGMGEGVMDNVPTLHRYTILLEPAQPEQPARADPLPSLSLLASILSRQLDHPPLVLHLASQESPLPPTATSLLKQPLPCDYHIINLRSWTPRTTAPSSHALLTLQRHAPDCKWASLTTADCLRPSPAPSVKFPYSRASFVRTTLTANHLVESKTTENLFDLDPMELAAYNVTFS